MQSTAPATRLEGDPVQEDWKTRQLREAEEQLETALADAEAALSEVERFSASLPEIKLGDEQIEQIEQLVREGKAPDEVKALQERIDAGDLSWQDIAEGRGLDNEAVRAAFQVSVDQMKRAKELLDEGHGIDAIIDADPNRPRSANDHYDDEPPDSFLQ